MTVSVATDICNLALFRVRGQEIGSLDEQSVEAEKCRVLYPQARDVVLSLNGISWPFAKKITALALDADTPEEWLYGYTYPTDCLKALYIVPVIDPRGVRSSDNQAVSEFESIPFEVCNKDGAGSTLIVTNQEDAKLAYVSRVEDVRLYGPLCVELIAWKLAIDLALPLGGDSGARYRIEASAAYENVLGQAMAAYKNQNQPKLKQVRPSSIRARGL